MLVDSQLAQLNNPGMKPCSATTVEHACARCQDQTGALHMLYDTNESESCLVKAPAKHASESVLVVGELLCTGVQANTERHTRKETHEMCSCWGYKQQQIHGPCLCRQSYSSQTVHFFESELLACSAWIPLPFPFHPPPFLGTLIAQMDLLFGLAWSSSGPCDVQFHRTCDSQPYNLSPVEVVLASTNLKPLLFSFEDVGDMNVHRY